MRISVYIPVYTKIHTQTSYFSKHETDPNKTNAKKVECAKNTVHANTCTHLNFHLCAREHNVKILKNLSEI